MSQRIPEFPPEYDFLTHCCANIIRQDYKDALQILKKGLRRNLESQNQINDVELMKHLQVVLSILESNLRQAYGYDWDKNAGVPKIPRAGEKMRCSFCGKWQGEVEKVICGGSANICNECVGVCLEILEDSKS